MLLTKHIHINMDKIERPKLYTLPDTLQAVQRPAAAPICQTRPAWYRVQAVRVRWGLGLHLWGIWGEPGVGWSTPRIEKIQKRRSLPTTPSFLLKTPYPLLSISKISRKNKKTPTKGLRSVLYLPYKP